MTTEPTNNDLETLSLADKDRMLREKISGLGGDLLDAIPDGAIVRAYAVGLVCQKEDGSLGTTTGWGGEGLLVSAGCHELTRMFNKTLSDAGF